MEGQSQEEVTAGGAKLNSREHSNVQILSVLECSWILIFGWLKSIIEVRQDTPKFLAAKLSLTPIVALEIDLK